MVMGIISDVFSNIMGAAISDQLIISADCETPETRKIKK